MRIPAAILACTLFVAPCFCFAQTQQPAASAAIPAGGKVTPAKLIHSEGPVYPRKARAGGKKATVSLSAVVTTDGNVEKIQVVSGPQEFVAAAIACVKKWKYAPTKLNGKPIAVQTAIVVHFRLKP